MTRRIAVYGKGGIGKSTVSSNLTAALSDMGVRVMQIGCDPKHDSTRALVGGREQTTVLDYLKTVLPAARELDGVVMHGYKGCLCVEAGGPEPGVGCAGRGIISAFDLLKDLGAEQVPTDLVLYDVLGDVVCGGFAVPLRNGYADTVYIVTSGEFMSIYAANNILRGTANYDPDRIGGIIFNSRGDPEEDDRVRRFSEAVGIPVIARIARSNVFMDAEKAGKTVVELLPDSDITAIFRNLAQTVLEGKRYTARYLSEHDLEKLILGRERVSAKAGEPVRRTNVPASKKTPYSSRNTGYGGALGGCAFSGASATCTSIEGLTTILHSPRSCAHFTMQLDGMSAIGVLKHNRKVIPGYLRPDVDCTYMEEKDMVFGGGKPLQELLERKVSEGVRDIAVITACPPGIIGDDSKGICAAVEEAHPGVKIALLEEDGNATGDFMQGVIDASIGLVGKFSEDVEKVPMTVNLIGCKTMSSTVIDDLDIVEDILGRIGVKVNCVLPGVTDMSAIRNVRGACANLRVNTDLFSEKICMYLEDAYGMEYLPHPVRGGMSGTRQWVRCVADFFGVREQADKVIAEIESEFSEMVSGARTVLEGKTAAIISLSGDVDWVIESLDRVGVKVLRKYVYYREDFNKNLDTTLDSSGMEVITIKNAREAMDAVNELHPDILLSMSTADVDKDIYQSRMPCTPETDPFAGRDLVYALVRGMLAPEKEGWREDVA